MIMIPTRKQIVSGMLAALAGLGAMECQAQVFPSRPVTLIHPYPPGPGLSGTFHLMSAEAAKLLGQPVIFETRPGANARLGLNAIREARPEGYVLTVASDAHLIHQPKEDANYRFDMFKDYTPVMFLAQTEFLLAAHPSVPFRDLKGLIAYSKQNPKKLNWAATPGSASTFAGLKIQQAGGIEVTMIPYKGSGESVSALVGGQIDLLMSGPLALKPQIDLGKIVGIVSTGKQRISVLPAVPTLTESGLPMAPMSTWFGIISTAGVPSAVTGRLYQAFNAGIKAPEVIRLLTAGGFTADPSMSTNDFANFVKAEVEAWK